MKGQPEDLLAGLSDVGCSADEIAEAKCIIASGNKEALTRHLKKCRAALLDQMHESQQKVDRIDYLIRQTEDNRN